jgi:hypothetical protein
MFRRTFWFATGAAAGVWATTKVNRALRRLTPESLAATAARKAVAAGERVREFAHDVREGMAEREDELHGALGAGPADARPALDARPVPPPLNPQAVRPQLPAARRRDAYNRKDGH